MSKYRLSFTFGGLLIPESSTVAQVHRRTDDWAATKEEVLQKNLLRKTRSSSSYRYFREIRDRLKRAYDWEMNALAGAGDLRLTETDVGLVLFAIFCRYYELFGDFVQQVVRRRLYDGLTSLDTAIFRSFLMDQEAVHTEIAKLSDSTREKLSTVAIRVLREAGFLLQRKRTEPGELQFAQLSPEVQDRYCREGQIKDYGHLLWSEEEISECMT